MNVISPLFWAKVGLEDQEAFLPRGTFERLPEYSCTIPTGTTLGKTWRRRHPYGAPEADVWAWWMGEYVADPQPGYVKVKWRRIVVIEAEPWAGYVR